MTGRPAVAALALLLLASCSGGILPAPPPAPTLYRLTPMTGAAAQTPASDVQLVVDMPAASGSLDTERIALARGANGFDYFAGAAWTDRAPAMVQRLIIQSLTNAGQIRVVAPPSGELRPDAVLQTDLRQFEAIYQSGDQPIVHVELNCRLVRLPERTVLAVQRFAGEARASGNSTAPIVAAFDQAFHAAVGALVPWVAQNLPARR